MRESYNKHMEKTDANQRRRKATAVIWVIIAIGLTIGLLWACLASLADGIARYKMTEHTAEIVVNGAGVMGYKEFYGIEEAASPDVGVGGTMAAEGSILPASAKSYPLGCIDYNLEPEIIPDYILDVPLDRWLQEYIHGLCEETGLPYTLAVAVIEAESNYIPWTISVYGDYGLMQINAVCHDWLAGELGITDFLDPYQSARAGIYILAGYYQAYGYESGALMAYNMGQGAAETLFAQGIYETEYSVRVMGIKWRLDAEGLR